MATPSTGWRAWKPWVLLGAGAVLAVVAIVCALLGAAKAATMLGLFAGYLVILGVRSSWSAGPALRVLEDGRTTAVWVRGWRGGRSGVAGFPSPHRIGLWPHPPATDESPWLVVPVDEWPHGNGELLTGTATGDLRVGGWVVVVVEGQTLWPTRSAQRALPATVRGMYGVGARAANAPGWPD